MDIIVRTKIEENVASQFNSNLLELNSNSKYVIHSLTILAMKHISHAGVITSVIEEYIPTVSTDLKLPLMYLIDSVTKNDKTITYRKLFATRIVKIFRGVFEKVNEEIREKLYFLRQTWKGVYVSNVLYDLDIEIKRLDNNWPVTAKPHLQNAHLNTIETISVELAEENSEAEPYNGEEFTAIQKQCFLRNTPLVANNTGVHTDSLLSINMLGAACLGAHQFLNIACAAEHLYTSRGPRSPYLNERNYKGRFVTTFQDLLNNEDKFKENFHMDPKTFFCIFSKVQGFLEPKRNTHPNDGITPKEKLAVVLEYFACGTLQRHIASVYRISKQHVGAIIDEVCEAICTALKNEIPPLSRDAMKKTADTFVKWDFPNCIGAIDGKHVAIKCPPKSGSMFFNYKGFFSIVLMAVANGDYQFTYFDIGAYGSEGDAGVFRNCTLGKAIKDNSLPFPVNETTSIPYVFIADDAFPLHQRIMKPYKSTKSTPLDESQIIFNYRLSRTRRCVENAFGIMCSKNYCLSKTMFCGPDRAKRIIRACIYIHNFSIRTRKETYCPPSYADRETNYGKIVNGNFRKDIPNDSLYHSNIHNLSKGRVHDSGKIVRDKIKNYFNSAEGSLSWQRRSAFLE